MEKTPALVESSKVIVSVLKTLGLRLVNDQRDGLAFKLHYLSHLLQLAKEHGVDAVVAK